jgi:HK97 family phage prohead protease
MSKTIIRATYRSDLEIRGGDGRTVEGIAVPFDTPTEILTMTGAYTEIFRRGAFARTIRERADRVKFLANHDARVMPLGRATALREDAAGLWGAFRVSRTTAGDEVLELIRDGALDAFSVGFRPIEPPPGAPPAGAIVERREVALHEVSVTAFPAYEGALIAAVRSADDVDDRSPVLTRSEALSRLDELAPSIPAADARRRVADLERQIRWIYSTR